MADVDIILAEFRELKELVKNINQAPTAPAVEIIDSDELMRRLGLSRATLITYRKNKTIPFIRIGASVRYNWTRVVDALEKKNGKK